MRILRKFLGKEGLRSSLLRPLTKRLRSWLAAPRAHRTTQVVITGIATRLRRANNVSESVDDTLSAATNRLKESILAYAAIWRCTDKLPKRVLCAPPLLHLRRWERLSECGCWVECNDEQPRYANYKQRSGPKGH